MASPSSNSALMNTGVEVPVIPHPFPDVGIDPRFRLPFTPENAAAAEKIKEERERTGDFTLPTPAASNPSTTVPPQPVPCIGIGPSARLPSTEDAKAGSPLKAAAPMPSTARAEGIPRKGTEGGAPGTDPQ
ncbi:hypothetical protein FB451DRAFT_1172958 [Mycena latifolia]|nr:hypothetical protein FB451DRAFT_1172958 [Mycena latifolia]